MSVNDEKELVRNRQRGYKVDEIVVKKAIEPVSFKDETKTIRVCAYCRVSTDNIEQTSSFELQKLHYEEEIAKHENWVLVDIYADEGISGTSLNHREGFKRMIADCKAGKIDMILTKSVSRFSRNVIDTIEITDELKHLNPPVGVYFETENIDSLDKSTDVILKILAMFAEEESHTKSSIMNWSIENRFQRGNFLTPELFGYSIDMTKEERYVVVEEEAEIVRLVYSMYVTGYSPNEIAETMLELGYKSNKKGDVKWNVNVVRNILMNERRAGMLIARKTFTPNFKDHKSKKNVNQRNQYGILEHHTGIIDVETYKKALQIKEMRRHRNYDSIPPLAVIKEGALKGFVPVCIKYSGFTYENYLFASDFAYEWDSDGNLMEPRQHDIDKRSFSAFDLSGYEKVDMQLITNFGVPMCWFNYNKLYFNKSCIDKMMQTKYIELLFEPHERLLAIRSCQASHEYAIKWASAKDDKITPIIKSSYGISNILFSCMGWNPKYKYRMNGVRRQKDDEIIVLFNLNNAEVIMTESVIDTETDKVKNKSVTLYDGLFVDHFGLDFYEDQFSMRLHLIDIFKKWELDAELIMIEDNNEWLINARKLVQKHLDKLKGDKF